MEPTKEPHPALRAGAAACVVAIAAQGLGALAGPGRPDVMSEWGLVAIPAMVALAALCRVARADLLHASPALRALVGALRCRGALAALIAGAWAVFFLWALQRYRTYEANAFDLADWHQVIWNTGHGHPFISSLMTMDDETWLAWHFSPTLALFSPLTWLTDSPAILLAAQSALLCLGAWPVQRFAARRLGEGALSHVVAVAYLASPLLRGANNYEFHEICLAVPCLAFTIDLLDRRRVLAAVPFIVVAALTKESSALAVGGIAAGFALRAATWKGRLAAAGLSAGMLAWFFVSMTVIVPRMGELSDQFFYLFRYDNLGGSVGEIVTNLLTHPWKFVTEPLGAPVKVLYLVKTVGPFALLPLLAPSWLLMAAPTYLMNTLGTYRPMHTVFYHYGAEMVPALAAATAVGLQVFLARFPSWNRRHAGYAIIAASLALYGASEPARFRAHPRTDVHDAYDAMLARIPPDAVTSCQTVFCPHLSARRYVYLFPRLDGRLDGPDGTLTRRNHPDAAARAIRAEYVVVDTGRDQPGYWQKAHEFLPSVEALPSLGYLEVDRVGTAALYRRQR